MKALYLTLLAVCLAQASYAQVPAPAPAAAPAGAAPAAAPAGGAAAESVFVSTAPPAAPRQAPAGKPSRPAEYAESQNPLSGLVLMPTAYRGRGKNSIGLGLDFNAAYYIGRLYGKNTYSWTTEKTNYIDRLGLWLLMADGKMLIQTEGKLRPAVAAGVLGGYQLRDAAQPGLNTPFSLSVKVDQKTNNTFASAYIALTKRVHPKFVLNAGYADGSMPKIIYEMSEFLSKSALLNFGGYSTYDTPTGMLFGGFAWLPGPKRSIAVEIMAPQGAPQSPKLVNLHLGTLLKLNFEISYLTFKGGWDMLGMFQFRYGYFPR